MQWFKSAPQPEPPKTQVHSATSAAVEEAQIPDCPVCGCSMPALLDNPSACCRSYLRNWWAASGA
jgi:hypothetical protein